MGPLSQHDRSAVELTMRLLRTSAADIRAGRVRARQTVARTREMAADECWLLLQEHGAEPPKDPPDPAVAPAGSST